VLTALQDLPPGIRGRYALAGAEDIDRRLAIAVDRAVGHQEDPPPTSRWWPFLGLLQSANQLLLAGVAAWIVIWFVIRPQVPDVTLPVVGPVPAPLALLGVALLVGYILARLLAIHAGWLGRRWARTLTGSLRRDLAAILQASAFATVERLEAARSAIAEAWKRAEADRRRDLGSNGSPAPPGLATRVVDRLSRRGSATQQP
jgi:hypothetical protein